MQSRHQHTAIYSPTNFDLIFIFIDQTGSMLIIYKNFIISTLYRLSHLLCIAKLYDQTVIQKLAVASRCNYFAPGMGAKYCDEYVCLSVCPLAYPRYHTAELHQIYCVRVACGRGSNLLWWRCDNLCTSGFVDDVLFSHSWLYGNLYAFLSGDSVTAEDMASISTKFCSTMKSAGTRCRLLHTGGAVCYLRFPCYCIEVCCVPDDAINIY